MTEQTCQEIDDNRSMM